MAETTVQKNIAGVICAGLLLGAGLGPMWSPGLTGPERAWAQGAAQAQSSKINRDLPGSRTGILTMAKGDTVRIDRATYKVAPDALIEEAGGAPLSLQSVVWVDVELPVRYWVGTAQASNQITQMIVTLAE
jgi:hypothetical protein